MTQSTFQSNTKSKSKSKSESKNQPQSKNKPPRQHLVLVGAGHAHLQVLTHLAKQPIANADITLVTCSAKLWYSGMLPALMAGHYSIDDIHIDVTSLCRTAGVTLIEHCIERIDADDQSITTTLGELLHYDVLSLNTGAVNKSEWTSGADHAHLLAVRPLVDFIEQWQSLLREASASDNYQLAVVGSGAGATELAMAAQVALRVALNSYEMNNSTHPKADKLFSKLVSRRSNPKRDRRNNQSGRQVYLVAGNQLLPGFDDKFRARVQAQLERLGILLIQARAEGIESGLWGASITEASKTRETEARHNAADMLTLNLDNQQALTVNAIIAATGVAAPAWTAQSQLAVNDAGFVAVNAQQQSISHPNVFAVGDIAGRVDQEVAHSGVHAVHGGVVLAKNITAYLAGQPLQDYQPRKRTLYLLSCGDHYAIASWGRFSLEGRAMWHLKQWIDKRFIRRHRRYG